MVTAEAELAKEPSGLPIIPEGTWWQLRKQFKGKPPRVVDEEYVINVLGYQSKASARNLIRPLKRVSLIDDDGKPTDFAYTWREDDEYAAACHTILEAVYPDSLRDAFNSPDADRGRVENWFSRNLRVGEKTARQYAAFYMLLLEADPSKQDETTAQKPVKIARAKNTQSASSRSGSSGAKASRASAATSEAGVNSKRTIRDETEDVQNTTASRRAHYGLEPSLNINIQIHIPAEASPDQVDQIFKSMAKHLYHRQDEDSE